MLSSTRLPRALAALSLRIGAVATALALVAGLAGGVASVAADAGATRYVSPSTMAAVLASAAAHKPDGLIRQGSFGYPGSTTSYHTAWVGNDVYNTSGAHQTATMKNFNELQGAFYTFNISIQNDGSSADRYKIKATGSGTGWTVTYFHGSTNITSAVVAGTYRTASVAPGCASCLTATYDITAKITISAGGDMSRLVTITSVADATKTDAVKFAYKAIACGC